MKSNKPLPPGQYESDIFPRFGLPAYTNRFPSETEKIVLTISGDLESFELEEPLSELARVSQVSDFHCVTTWSKLQLNWSGVRFSEFYEHFVEPRIKVKPAYVVLKAQDGYKTSMILEDLLRSDVLIADRLDGETLPVEHGAPVRIIAPAHYGYKNVKHLNGLEFHVEKPDIKKGIYKIIDHQRARVAEEERAVSWPGKLLRYLYKIGINSTIKDYEKATAAYKERMKHGS